MDVDLKTQVENECVNLDEKTIGKSSSDIPAVSVIMPVYNCNSYVLDSIKSIENQTYTDWELIIIEDASNDNSFQVIDRYIKDRLEKGEKDNIKIYKNEKNLGVAHSRNRGISKSSGEFVAFIDSDDIWVAEKLSLQMEAIEKSGADLSYSSYTFIDGKGDGVKKPYIVLTHCDYKSLLRVNVIGCSTVVLKGDLVRPHCFTKDFFHEDYVLWLSLLKKGVKPIGVKEVLVNYRTGGRSSNKFKAAKNKWKILRTSEHIGVFKSSYFMFVYFFHGIKKHFFV